MLYTILLYEYSVLFFVADYRFVRYEFDVALLIVYLGVLRLVSRHRVVAYLLDVVSSVYLLWATYTRQFYLHNTSVGQWAKDLCSAIVSDKELIYNYLAVSVVSWVASSFLEWNSVVHFKKLYSTRLWRCLRWSGLSRSRWLVLTLALACTVNSLVLTLVLWSTVHHSFENVSQDRSILTFNTIAALMRLLRQFVEGLTFIAGIVTRNFRWHNSREEKLMGRIAFSSFMLLIHSSALTYTFCNTRVWSFDQLIVFSALLVDVGFQIVVCLWAALNSCCYATAKEYITNLTFHRFRSAVRGSLHFSFTFTTVCTLCSFAISTVTVVGLRLKSILHFCVVAVQILLMFAVGGIRLACFCVSLVLTVFVEAWRNYVLHWQIDVDFDDPTLELVEPVQVQLVYQETHGHAEDTPREVVFPSYSVHNQYSYDSHYSHCNVLANEILKSQYNTTQNKHLPSVVSSSPSFTLSASSHSTAPSVHEPLSWQEERDSTCHTCLCTFECSPQPQTAPPYFPASPPQPLPVQQREALIAPSLPITKLGGQQSELVAR